MKSLSLKQMIEKCDENLTAIPERHHGFVRDMVEKQKKYGDKMFVTRKQVGYLWRLIGGFCPKIEEKPKSRLEELKAKKDKLLLASAKRAHNERLQELRSNCAKRAVSVGLLRVDDAVTARMVHDKNVRTEHRKQIITRKTVTDD